MSEFTEQQIKECMQKVNIEKEKDILIFTLDANGSVYIQPKNGDCKSFTIDYQTQNKW